VKSPTRAERGGGSRKIQKALSPLSQVQSSEEASEPLALLFQGLELFRGFFPRPVIFGSHSSNVWKKAPAGRAYNLSDAGPTVVEQSSLRVAFSVVKNLHRTDLCSSA